MTKRNENEMPLMKSDPGTGDDKREIIVGSAQVITVNLPKVLKEELELDVVLSELFIVEPQYDFKITRIGKFEEGLMDKDERCYSFSYTHDVLYIKSANDEKLIPSKFESRNDIFFIGNLESVTRIDDGIVFHVVPTSEEDTIKGLRKIDEEYGDMYDMEEENE